MRSSKSRSRNKNRSRSPQGGGNIVNRTFDSSGPEGKVRGTPAQIIEKYNQLARDAQLSGDRVALENFQQHSEHYTRMLAAAQKEIDSRQQQGNQGQQGYNQNVSNQNSAGGQNGGQQNSGGQNGGGQNTGQQGGGHQQNNGQHGNQQGGGAQGGGQDTDLQSGNQQNTPQGGRQGGNRRREKPETRDNDPRESRSGSDVMDAPEADSGLVETPEARDTIAPAAPKAERPKRTRTRKKAPAETPPEPASEG